MMSPQITPISMAPHAPAAYISCMTRRHMSACAAAAVALACSLVIAAAIFYSAGAGESSAWDGGPHAKVRLVAGTADKAGTGMMHAGIEIQLGPGWKTYWRYPGDSGVPPRFRFDRSDNVETVAVLWPAPYGFSDDGGRSIGYKDGVVLPLLVMPREPGKPVVLRLDLDYAVCERLCVPAEAKAELALMGGVENAALAASEARVPKPVALGEGGALAIKAIHREAGPRPRIVVDVAAPVAAVVELFAEGPAADWALPVPEPIAGAPSGLRRFAFELDGVPPGASAQGAVIKLTAVTPEAAIEVQTRLD